MEKIRKIWINPTAHERFHLVLTVFWFIMIIPTLLWFSESVKYLVAISLYAIIIGHFSSYEATKAENITKKDIEGEFDDLEKGDKMEDFIERKRKEQSG